MNEFLIQLQAILDKETSKGNINKSIERIQNQINKLKIQAEIDPNSILAIKKQLEQLTKQPITLGNINIGQSQIDKAGKEIGKGISDSVQRGFNDSRINTDKLNADIKTLKNNLNTFASKNAGFETFKTEINGAEVSLESLIGKLSSVNNVTDLSTLRSQANALKTSFTELAQVNKIQMQLDTGGYESKVETLVSRTMQWTDENGNARISTDALKQSLDKLIAASAAYANNKTEEAQRRLIESEKELDKQLKTVTNSVRKMNAELAKDSAVSSLHNKIQTFYDNNSASHGRWGAQLKQMLSETASGAELTTQRVREIEQSFNRVATAARQAGKVGKSWFQSLKEGAKLFSAWTSPTMLMMRGISEVKKGISAVKELDTALVDLKKTTTMTSGQLEEFYYDSNNTAKQMGVITKEIIDQAGAWSRLGFNTAETATQMAKYSSQFASISPGMSVDNATTSLVSIMKAYDIDVDNVLDGILSKINDIGNKFGTSNAEIAEGLSKSSAAMAAVGGSIEDNIALFTAGQEIVQDASTVGNAIRSIALRIRGYDEETEQLSDDLVDVTGKVADLTKAASNGGHGISLFTDASQTEYKSLVSYLGEISDIWDELDQKSQNELLDKLFGKNRAQVGAAIIKNFDAVRDSIEVMGNSAGSADREMSVIMDGLDYKLNRLKETGTGIAQNLFERDEMKSVVDGFTSFLEIIDSLTSKIGLLGTIGAGAGLFAGFKNTGIFKAVQSTDDSGVENTRIATSSQARRMAQDELNASLARQAAQLEADTAALQTYEAECAHGTVTTERFAAVMNGASSEAQAYAVQTKGAAGSAQAFTARQKQVQAELEATAKASKAATIAGKALSIALNMIAFAAIAKGISFVAEKLSDLANASEISEEKASSFAESLNSSMENIAGNRSTLEKLNDEYQKLAKGVNDLGINTGLSAEQYDRYKEIMAQVSDIMPDLTARFNAQGEAIAFTKGKLEDLNKEYEKSIQKNAKKLLTEGNEDGETPQDVIDNFNSNSRMGAWENFVNGMKNMFGSYDIDDLPADAMLSTFRKMQNKTRDEISDFLNDVETDGTGQYIYTESNRAKSIAQHVLDETAASIRQMDDEAFNQLQLDIAANIESLENSIDTDMEKVKSVLLESMNSKDAFWALDEGQRENVSTLLSSLTADAWKAVWDGNEDISPSDMYAFVERIISAVRSNEGGFADAWMDLFSIDEDIPVNEYVEKVRSFMNAICDVLKIEGEENRIQWMLSLGFDIETDEASIIGLKEKLSNLNGGAKNQDAAKWVDTLTKEELEFAHSDEFINALEEQKKQLGGASLSAQDYETALDKVKSAQKNFDKDSKITNLTDFIGKLDEDAIKNYNDKISSLKSYLDKLKSGDFSNADKSSLADDYGITGDSVDELTEKIQELMDTEMDSIIAQIDKILDDAYKTNDIYFLKIISQSAINKKENSLINLLDRVDLYSSNVKIKARKYAILAELCTHLAYYGLNTISKPI